MAGVASPALAAITHRCPAGHRRRRTAQAARVARLEVRGGQFTLVGSELGEVKVKAFSLRARSAWF